MILILVLAAASFVGALVVLADTVTPAARRRHTAVMAVRRVVGMSSRQPRYRAPVVVETAERLGAHASSARFRERLPQRIAAAGLAGRVTSEAFLALRVGAAAIGLLGGLCLAAVTNANGPKTLLLCAAFAAASFLIPSYLLERMARGRRARIREELPDALDLLAVSVEAGLGLYAAISRIAQASAGPLADEFALVLTELRVGDSSERALTRMAKRLRSPEVEAVVRSLIQGEQLGLSLAQTLRNLAEDARQKRRLAAEEQAAKAPVKMLVPTALFIFPALFVVILGPAFLEIKKYL